MNVTVIGAGYVGLTTAAVLAELGHSVVCMDKDRGKIADLQRGNLPVFEPGLHEMAARNSNAGRLAFSADFGAAVKDAELIMVAVGTPPTENGEPDLGALWEVVGSIKHCLDRPVTVAIKSTVPVGTCRAVWDYLNDCQGNERTNEKDAFQYDVVFLPEFLRQGSAIADFLSPDRTVAGCRTEQAKALVGQLFPGLHTPALYTDWQSAEMIKYAANSFLAMKISFINTIANLCEEVGADIQQVARGVGMDKRIGPAFLQPGVGFGGSCLPKDTQALAVMGQAHGVNVSLLQDTLQINAEQRIRIVGKLEKGLGGLQRKRIAVLGLAFKANTNDVREAPALTVILEIASRGGQVIAYDPVVNMLDLCTQYPFRPAASMYDAVAGTDAIVIMTDWEEFRCIDLQRVCKLVRTPLLVDGRNLLSRQEAEQHGFTYIGVGVS